MEGLTSFHDQSGPLKNVQRVGKNSGGSLLSARRTQATPRIPGGIVLVHQHDKILACQRLMTRGPSTASSSKTSTTSSRTAKSSSVAWLEVLTLCRTTLPVSMSSARARNSSAVWASSTPKPYFPVFLAHSAAFIMFLLPD